jgi:hypothetical protein
MTSRARRIFSRETSEVAFTVNTYGRGGIKPFVPGQESFVPPG